MVRTTVIYHGDALSEAMSLALADAAARARAEFPDIFAAADRIKLNPNRQRQTLTDFRMPTSNLSECAWCGDTFMRSIGWRPQACCSHRCSIDYQRWRRRRAG